MRELRIVTLGTTDGHAKRPDEDWSVCGRELTPGSWDDQGPVNAHTAPLVRRCGDCRAAVEVVLRAKGAS